MKMQERFELATTTIVSIDINKKILIAESTQLTSSFIFCESCLVVLTYPGSLLQKQQVPT